METAFFNGKFIPRDEIKISPDDRGFLFADGIYEVIRWYEGFFYDMQSHMERLKRSLKETRIDWPGADTFPASALELIKFNDLEKSQALLYFQVTRGVAPRAHAFPHPPVSPTVYATARNFTPENRGKESGVRVMLREDIRWSRCDIKSVALLPNTLCYQEALDKGFFECAFVRKGVITECSHSNIFFVADGILYTHPESVYVLGGITRKNILRLAGKTDIPVRLEGITDKMLKKVHEAFLTNTSGEITPVIEIGGKRLGNGKPGPVTRILRERFYDHICSLKHS
jgi:D-alanine transaminase